MGSTDYVFVILSFTLIVAMAAWLFGRLLRRRRARKDAHASTSAAEMTHCSFCRKSREDVVRLLHGADASICDECVRACERILAEGREEDLPASPPEPELPVN